MEARFSERGDGDGLHGGGFLSDDDLFSAVKELVGAIERESSQSPCP